MSRMTRRRRAMMTAQGGGRQSILPNGTYHFATSGETIEITNGNHVKISFGPQSNQDHFINLSDLTLNSQNSINATSAVNNLQTVFASFPQNSTAVLEISNLTKTASETLNASDGQLVLGMRETGGSTSVIGGVGFLSQSNTVLKKTVEFQTQKDVSCLFVYYIRNRANVELEFDVSLTVNGQKLI